MMALWDCHEPDCSIYHIFPSVTRDRMKLYYLRLQYRAKLGIVEDAAISQKNCCFDFVPLFRFSFNPYGNFWAKHRHSLPFTRCVKREAFWRPTTSHEFSLWRLNDQLSPKLTLTLTFLFLLNTSFPHNHHSNSTLSHHNPLYTTLYILIQFPHPDTVQNLRVAAFC